ncbi:shikimate kinase [Hylemonella gracilis]|uniref:Shikimate kinase n=1 Tax=Hylemonella gracilis TaxID=80880 RepID=A0A4P6UMG4_9BURK|nr:shikimate kinase [Hylemonella gracilis]QBK04721.1 shikimate kinase [Hylemonella gracilis]
MFLSFVGMPGSGKSTVGRHLARRLHLPFHDSDHVIEQRIGCSIREFFEREGEDRFREIEADTIASLCLQGSAPDGPGGVLSTGGGAVLREANRQQLRSCSHAIYLRTTPEELMRRLKRDTHRPLLQTSDPLQRLRDLYVQRDPLYRETAHFVVETGRPSVSSLANIIVTQLELAGIQVEGLTTTSRPS